MADDLTPLFSCQDKFCRTEHSWPVELLRTWNDKPICEDCYDEVIWREQDDEIPPWSHLPAFVPPYQAENAKLVAERDALRSRLNGLQAAEYEYRFAHDHYGDDDRRTGRAWDLMRRQGDKARLALKGEAQ